MQFQSCHRILGRCCLVLVLLALFGGPGQLAAGPNAQSSSGSVMRTFWHPAVHAPSPLGSPRASARALGLSETGASPRDIALRFVSTYRQSLNLNESAADWRVGRAEAEGNGVNHVRLKQSYKGLSVFGADLVVHITNNTVASLNGQYLADIQVDTQPTLTTQAVLKAVVSAPGYKNPQLRESQLVIFDPALLGAGTDQVHLAYSLVVDDPGADISDTVFVDAHTGKWLHQFSNYESSLSRWIGDLNGGSTLPGTLCYNESGPVGTPRADCVSAFNFTGDTYNYYYTTFGRDSFDNHGALMRASVYWGTTANAQWTGTQTRYGPGYATRDVVAHEWTHAVNQYTANLIYSNQSGALNESMSDVFGAMVDRDDWLMGEDTPGGALRSLADPTIYGHPGKASDFRCTTSDYGGVHTNSGIANHAAYLMSEGGSYNGRNIVGFGRGPTERIFYRALTVYLTSSSSINDAYNALASSATDLYGFNSSTYINTLLALQATEMNIPINCGGTTTPDAYEQDNTAGAANTITVNGSAQTHNFHVAGDNDWVKFTAVADNVYTISTSNLGSTSDTYLYLYDTNGSTILREDDDSGGGLASRIVWTATGNGTYYARVRHYSASASGSTTNYNLGVTGISGSGTPDAYEPDDVYSQASTLSVNGSAQSHNFHFAGDNDWARFSATVGTHYVIQTQNLGSSSDTYMYLYGGFGPDGSILIAQDDDSGGGLASRIAWTATGTGTYYVRVRHYSSTVYGSNTSYDLAVTGTGSAADWYEPDNSAAQAKPIAVNGSAQSHTFHIAGDNDWVYFSASPGTSYTLQTSNLGSCSDTYLYLYGTDGSTLIASDDDSGGSLASRIVWTPTSSGTYYARLRHYSSSAGGSCASYNFAITGTASNADPYEPDNSAAQASTITVNGSAQSHNIHVAGDNDWAKFTATSGTSYVIETLNLGSCGDTYLYLYGTDGSTVLLSDDDSGDGLASRIMWSSSTSGVYYVRVRHYNSSAYGSCTSYDLRVTGTSAGADAYEPDGSAAQASTLTVNGSAQTHDFHVAGDVDWAKLIATSGTSYVIETLNLGSSCDTYLYLYAGDGTTLLGQNDDGGGGYASRIIWTPTSSGVYYAKVRHYNSSAFGAGTNYDLRVRTGTAFLSDTSFSSRIDVSTKQARQGDEITLTVYAAGDATAIKANTTFKSAYLRLLDVTPATSAGARAGVGVGVAQGWLADTNIAGRASARYAPSGGLNSKSQLPAIQFRWEVVAPVGSTGLKIPVQVTAMDKSGRPIAFNTHTLWLYAPTGEGAPKIDQVQPTSVASNSDNNVSILGSDFAATPKVYLQAGGSNINVQEVVLVDSTVLIIKIPAGFKPDTYKARVVNPDNSEGTYDGFQVTQTGTIHLPLITR